MGKERKEGFYWVRLSKGIPWTIAKWEVGVFKFNNGSVATGRYFDEINENRIVHKN
jgi:hypothetical protein